MVNSNTIVLEGLTLENFHSQTGHRFRMTKEQKSRAITREAAFGEFVAAEQARRAAPPVVAAPVNVAAPTSNS